MEYLSGKCLNIMIVKRSDIQQLIVYLLNKHMEIINKISILVVYIHIALIAFYIFAFILFSLVEHDNTRQVEDRKKKQTIYPQGIFDNRIEDLKINSELVSRKDFNYKDNKIK